ncbi:MAG TPA: hypothetical protein DEP87_00900 [Candidatus Pacebacteria bacterium]|nr:hypothetical protein [Candidatus Paceibacterota bacterium]
MSDQNRPLTQTVDGQAVATVADDHSVPTTVSMSIKDLVASYTTISNYLNSRWPLPDGNQRTFARTMKIMEELGELSDEILTSMNLSRDSKIAKFSRENIEDEFADVMACILLLGIELKIDVEAVMRRKIQFTHERYDMDKSQKN